MSKEYNKDQILYKEVMKCEWFSSIFYGAAMAITKVFFYYGVFLHNGFNIPIFWKWAGNFRVDRPGFFSASTAKFALLFLGMYIISIHLRSISGLTFLNKTLKHFKNEHGGLKHSKKENKEINDYYLRLQKKIPRPTEWQIIKTQIYRDIDLVTTIWTTILYPISYTHLSIIPEVRMLYLDEEPREIAHRLAQTLSMYKYKFSFHTVVYFLLNFVLPVTLIGVTITYPTSFLGVLFEDPMKLFILWWAINAITYGLQKYRYLAVFITYNKRGPVDKSKLKTSKAVVRWDKILKSNDMNELRKNIKDVQKEEDSISTKEKEREEYKKKKLEEILTEENKENNSEKEEKEEKEE